MSETESSPEDPAAAARKKSLRPLLAHAGRHWRRYALGFVTLALVDYLNSCVLTRLQGEPFKPGLTVEAFARAGAAYVGVSVVIAFFRYFWRYFFLGTSETIGREIRARFFEKLQRLPVATFDRAKTGDLMSRATNDMEAVRSALGLGALLAFDALCYFVMVPTLLVSLSPRLMLVLIVCVIPVPIIVKKIGAIVHDRSATVQDVFGELSARLQENFSGIRVVQAFAQEERELARLDAVGQKYLRGQLSLARVQAAFNPAIETFFDGAAAVILLFGGYEVLAGRLEVYQLVIFASAMNNLVWPMMAVGWLMNVLQRGAAAHARIEEILERAEDPTFLEASGPSGARSASPAPPEPLAGAIAARGLTFRYPGTDAARPPALADVSFEVPAGALVAVVGPIGSGKTTLLSLLARLYEPPAGQLFLDGEDLLRVPVARLRRSVALVPQETFLFSASIEENVKLGRQDELSHEDVVRAATAAQVASEIEGVPGGYGALLGERGVNLSGGQRQRVAIARALVRTPRILLLDDALSAVDTATETAIDHELRRTGGPVPPTRIVATHRLATARAADLVLVLEGGRLVESGKHADLVARGGLYSRLARRDALAEELARV